MPTNHFIGTYLARIQYAITISFGPAPGPSESMQMRRQKPPRVSFYLYLCVSFWFVRVAWWVAERVCVCVSVDRV